VARFAALFLAAAAQATIFGSVRGIVHDPQHRPLSGAMVMLRAVSSDWAQTRNTDENGGFAFNPVPLGEYTVVVVAPGFKQLSEKVTVHSASQSVLHLALNLAEVKETVSVSGTVVPTDSATPTTLVDRVEVEHTPGAMRTNSLAMITDFVPGAVVAHDQLHVRGGHQTSWLIDGVPIPNTNIASNLGPQFDPKDIDYMEVDRGSLHATQGDRTYAGFNIVPRTGFERNHEAELVTSVGNFYQSNDEFSLGSHTQKFAYYVSANGNRSNLGVATPVPAVFHDAENGYGGFLSLILNVDPADQLRLVSSARRDHYEIPYDPYPNDLENNVINGQLMGQYPSLFLRDTDTESDALANFSWVHSFSSESVLTLSPFYHYNRADYDSSPGDFPTGTTEHRGSTYGGGQASVSGSVAGNNFEAGFYGFYQQDNEQFGVMFKQAGAPSFSDREHPTGSLIVGFVDDKVQLARWLTLSAGIRPTRFSSVHAQSAISPRFGAALTVPRLKWTFRAFYGHYYQAPPLLTASGPLIQLARTTNTSFIPLSGERDEEHQFGVSIPYQGWTLDADTFRTSARNYFDHNNIGESNLFFPLTIERAAIRGWELTLRSPLIAQRGRLHLAYSNQIAEAGGAITGGLTDFSVLPFGPLDHDQRNTLALGGDVRLPAASYAAMDIFYGSGFSNAFAGQPYPGSYLPAHTTADLAVGKDFGERLSASVNVLNALNRRVELDNSVTFGGFHWNNPREVYFELRYRFHY
jgi:hypothetical protein